VITTLYKIYRLTSSGSLSSVPLSTKYCRFINDIELAPKSRYLKLNSFVYYRGLMNGISKYIDHIDMAGSIAEGSIHTLTE
jgi:hypothetical protein